MPARRAAIPKMLLEPFASGPRILSEDHDNPKRD
jgi:hypothetical protein